jgi:hypothetical protein
MCAITTPDEVSANDDDDDDLGMQGQTHIPELVRAVPGFGDDLAVPHEHAADGYFTSGQRLLCLGLQQKESQ